MNHTDLCLVTLYHALSTCKCNATVSAMEANGLKHAVNGLVTEKPLLPRVIEFVKASVNGLEANRSSLQATEDEPPPPQYSLFSHDRLAALFQESSPRRVGRGLQNVGNTCYFNSVVQVLTHAGPLQTYLLSKQHTSECKSKREGTVCSLCLFESHLQEAFEASKSPFRPVKLLRHLPEIAARFRQRGRQEDAHEFLIHFLDACFRPVLVQSFGRSRCMTVGQAFFLGFGGNIFETAVSAPRVALTVEARCHKSLLKHAAPQQLPRPVHTSKD